MLKAIPRFPGYLADDQGNIYSTKRSGSGRSDFTPKLMQTKQRHKKRQLDYLSVNLRRDGKCYTESVHTLVLETFVGSRPDGCLAIHLNDIGDDNRLSNLRWGTPEENRRIGNKNRRYYKRFWIAVKEKFPQIAESIDSDLRE